MQDMHMEFERVPTNSLKLVNFKGGGGCQWHQMPGQPEGWGYIDDFDGGMAAFDNDGIPSTVPNGAPGAANYVICDGTKLLTKPNFDWVKGSIVNPSLPTPSFFYLYMKTSNA
jgi:hypothetical protein